VTTTQKTNATLPESATNTLQRLREESEKDFFGAIISLRNANWPYRAIGEAFGVTRAAARSWYVRALDDPEAVAASEKFFAPSLPLSARGSDAKVKRLKPTVAPADRDRIRSLTVRASTVRRWTPPNDPSRAAAQELESLIYHYVKNFNVSPGELAKYAGVSRRAVAQRLEKAEKANS
jgi:hypothetical protein